MDRIRTTLTTIVTLAILLSVLVGALWLLYIVLRAAFNAVIGMESDIVAALVTVSVTGLLSVLSLVLSKRMEVRAAINRDLRERKLPVYEKLISFMFQRVMFADKLGKKRADDAEVMKFMADVVDELIVWGADGVVKGFVDFRMGAVKGDNSEASPGVELLFLYEKLLFEIRKDLGHDNKGMGQGTLLRLFINDVDKYLPSIKKGVASANTNKT